MAGITIQRSSLPRSGVEISIGTWDVGYRGRGVSVMDVKNPLGFTVEKNARIVQMHFIEVGECLKLYNGTYHNENLKEEK